MSVTAMKKYRVMLFNTVSAAMKAEKMMLLHSVPYKLIPVPRMISSDCGICLRYDVNDEANVLKAVGDIDYLELRDI